MEKILSFTRVYHVHPTERHSTRIVFRKALAHDASVEDTTKGFSGVTLAHTVSSPAGVDAVFKFALSCGATSVKPPKKVFWGGYSGYFADPDGHLWEIAHNPFFPMDEMGHIVLPD